jgi:hypothetical protein
LEAFTYYSAPDKIMCSNECNGFFVGMSSTGGRRNMVFNVNDPNVISSTGNNKVTSDNGLFTSNGFGLMNYEGIQKYQLKSNDSATADYGIQLLLNNSNKRLDINLPHNFMGMNTPGFRIKLVSPDGTKIKYLGLNNNGEIGLFDYNYFDNQ